MGYNKVYNSFSYNYDNSNFDTYDLNNYMNSAIKSNVIASNVSEAKKYVLDNAEDYKREVKIGVIDSGVYKEHDAIKGRFAGGKDFTSNNDNQGGIDTFGHGTAVASVIVDCTLPNTKIVSYKISNDKATYPDSLIILAIEQAIIDNIDILNMSFSSTNCNKLLSETIDKAHNNDICIVSGAGNDWGADNNKNPQYPSCLKYVIGVGATKNTSTIIAPYSNRGSDIQLFFCGELNVATIYSNSIYGGVSGTSFLLPEFHQLALL